MLKSNYKNVYWFLSSLIFICSILSCLGSLPSKISPCPEYFDFVEVQDLWMFHVTFNIISVLWSCQWRKPEITRLSLVTDKLYHMGVASSGTGYGWESNSQTLFLLGMEATAICKTAICINWCKTQVGEALRNRLVYLIIYTQIVFNHFANF